MLTQNWKSNIAVIKIMSEKTIDLMSKIPKTFFSRISKEHRITLGA